eukprot:RCo006702
MSSSTYPGEPQWVARQLNGELEALAVDRVALRGQMGSEGPGQGRVAPSEAQGAGLGGSMGGSSEDVRFIPSVDAGKSSGWAQGQVRFSPCPSGENGGASDAARMYAQLRALAAFLDDELSSALRPAGPEQPPSTPQ